MAPRWFFLAALVPLLTLAGSAFGAPPAPGGELATEPLPVGALVRLGSPRLRPESNVLATAFSADGKSLFTVGHGQNIQVWDSDTGRQRRRISLAAGTPLVPTGVTIWGGFAIFTPDARTLVFQGVDGNLHVFDTEAGKVLRTIPNAGTQFPQRLSIADDGKRLAVKQQDNTITVWNLAEGKSLCNINGLQPGGIATLTPDGKQLVAAWPDNSYRLVDAETGREVRKLETGFAPEHATNPHMHRLVLSRDGKQAIFAAWAPDAAITSLETGKVIGRVNHQMGFVQGMALSPNGRFLAMGLNPGARIFGIASGKELRQLECGPNTYSHLLVYSRDGKRLAGVGQDGSIRLWDVATGRPLYKPIGHTGAVIGMAFLRDGTLVSIGQDMRLLAWDTAAAKVLHQYHGLPFNAATMVRTADGTGVQGVGYDRSLHIWHPGGELEMQPAEGPQVAGYQSAMSRDGKRWAMMSHTDRKLRLFESGGKDRDGRLLSTPLNVWMNVLQFSPDGGRLMAMASDGLFRVWDSASGREVRAFAQENNVGWGPNLRFTPDGRCLLLDGADLRLYEIASGRKRLSIPSTAPGCTALTCSDDGSLVARGNADGTLAVYDMHSGREIAHFDSSHGQVQSLAFSPDNRVLASGAINGLIFLWKMPALPAPSATLADARKTALWNELADADPERAGRALATLLEVPGPAVEVVRERLKFTGVAVDRSKLERLVADLDSDEFVVREKATEGLAAAGAAAGDVMRKAVDKASPEARRRLQELLARLDDKGGTPEHLRAIRAIELLEQIGTPPARQLLTQFLGEVKDADVETEIRDSLRRLGETARLTPRSP
jgi:WD40 repeat protein